MYIFNEKFYNYSLEAIMDVLGGKWRSLILWQLFHTKLRFTEIQKAVPEISKKVLSEQLKVLEKNDLIIRTVYPNVPPQVEYEITERGKSLSIILNQLEEWGRVNLYKNNNFPKNFIRKDSKSYGKDVTFQDLFNIDEIQLLQDQFSIANNVASIITEVDGTPITVPSNFTNLCQMIRETEEGCRNCYKSDAEIGKFKADGPTIQICKSAGLWDAGAAISVGGKHIANWLIGQVRDGSQTEDNIRIYANKIRLNEGKAIKAFQEVPSMTPERFKNISHLLYTFANQLSAIAYQNVLHSQNIKELKYSQKKIKSLNENLDILNSELETIIQEAPNPIILHEKGGKILMLNRAWIDSSGFTLEDIPTVDKWVESIYDEQETIVSIKKNIHSLYDITEKIDEGEFTFYNKNKRLITWHFSSAPLQTRKGKKIIISSAMDITELKEKDIKNRLEDNEIQEGMETINKEVQYLSKTVNEFKDLLKVKTEKSEFQINNTFKKIFELVGHQFINENIIIDKNIPNIHLYGFENKLTHVIINILNNAKDELVKKTLNKKLIIINSFIKNNLLKIIIKDNAGGIPEHFLTKIFDSHFTTKESSNGTGIGLYMSKTMIEEQMKGNIKVNNVSFTYENISYKGAEFIITLPLK